MTSRMQTGPVLRVHFRRDDNRNVFRNLLDIGLVDVQPRVAVLRACALHVARKSRVNECSRNKPVKSDKADQGIVIDKDWSAVQIKWESGKMQSFHHNDMAMVLDRAPVKRSDVRGG